MMASGATAKVKAISSAGMSRVAVRSSLDYGPGGERDDLLKVEEVLYMSRWTIFNTL
jgi:hypothetical protein